MKVDNVKDDLTAVKNNSTPPKNKTNLSLYYTNHPIKRISRSNSNPEIQEITISEQFITSPLKRKDSSY